MTAAAKEYGGALYALAAEEHIETSVQKSLQLACQLFKQNLEYVNLLQNPAVKKAERLELIDNAFRGNVHEYVLNFCKILCEKNGLKEIFACEEEFTHLFNEASGILPVTAKTALPLSIEQIEALTEKLQASTGKTILITNIVDESVLGGVKLVYQGKEIDGTTKGRLSALRNVLLQN